jgi:hypothetical protein
MDFQYGVEHNKLLWRKFIDCLDQVYLRRKGALY